ncbi:MAG: dienelactone hydrolase family protein [Longimicrobiaceae bacterium]
MKPRTMRYLHAWLRGARGVREVETTVTVQGEEREATLCLPPGRGPAPGWVVLHGLTVPGRRHAGMMRFVRSLAASGAVVLVPDVPSWRALQLDLDAARATVRAGVMHLEAMEGVQAGGVGAVGFSFGATQVLMAAADPTMHGRLNAVVAFGGYCDSARMLRCLFAGEHEWDGVRYTLDPDPYGRWIVVGNYLTWLPGCEGMGAVARAALELALEAGRRGEWAWGPRYDAMKVELSKDFTPDERRIWEVLAPPSGVQPDLEAARALAERFAAEALKRDPGLDPRPHLGALRARVVLSHGRQDRLVPFTEALRLMTLLPPETGATATITGLFAHSTGAWLHPVHWLRETSAFVRLLDQALYAI